jgi:chromosome segregation ATPase
MVVLGGVSGKAGAVAVLGLFSRVSPKEQRVRLQDVSAALKQKERELAEMQRMVLEIERKAILATELDKRIRTQQQTLQELEREAEQRLKEFKRAEGHFGEREATVRQAESALKKLQSTLEEKRKLLAQKEAALVQRENVVAQRKRRAERLEHSVRHLAVPAERRRERVLALIAGEEKKLQNLKSLHLSSLKREESLIQARIAQASQKLASLSEARTAADHELMRRRREVHRYASRLREAANMRKSLEKAHKALSAKAEMLSIQEGMLGAREKALAQKAAELGRKMRALEAARQDEEQSLKLRADAERAIREKQSAADAVLRIAQENTHRLKDLRMTEKHLTSLKRQLDQRKREIEQKLTEIERKEKSTLQREAGWLDHQKRLRVSLDELIKAKKDVEGIIAERKGELANLEQEWNTKIGALRDEKEFVRTQVSELKKSVQADLDALKEKEREILAIVKEFDNDQERLAKEEKAVVRRVRELEKEQRIVEHTKKGFAAREARIIQQEKTAKTILAASEKAKALKIQLPGLRREAAQLNRKIASLLKSAAKRSIKVIRIPARAPQAISAEAPQPGKARVRHPAVAATQDDIQVLVEGARAAVQAGDTEAGLKILADLEEAAKRLSEEDRKQLGYEIKDLRTSIKLAMLS